ncbi:ATP-binding protein [Corynebacterium sp. P7202]|uniref:AAA family ATPase n=1 Tax=Corynebacterium pygosceleis TaxID=2800406 RepID=A0A9Q4C8A9_9CORY|nr:AAA family ATPase [Corynebacterium pygosceleis]MCK7638060.1 ATP-binding protein [Corynebacterium pygosceleis]MCX7468776.1 AAA family ATPase [Corynebacterium pygosceleis]
MRLTKAEFSGFGRLADTQINLDHKVVAIVGPNEAGKTTLLRALAYVGNGKALTVSERSRGFSDDIADEHTVVRVQYRLSSEDQAAVEHLDLTDSPTELWLSRTAGPGDVRIGVIPAPRKNLDSLASSLQVLKTAAADYISGEPEDLDEGCTSLIGRLSTALSTLRDNEEIDLEQQVREFAPANWIAEFNEYGLNDDILLALEKVRDWVSKDDPAEEVEQILYARSPAILLFSKADRNLESSYELTGETVKSPPAALRNISMMAELSLEELLRKIKNGDEGARETLIEEANQTLHDKFTQVWNQSNISVHLKINGRYLEIRIKQDGRRITRFDERSAGVQMFVALVGFLNMKGQTRPPILLIDEAEAHLHIDAQADLVNEFMT